MLFLRALFAFLVLPAVVGGFIPWMLLAGSRERTHGYAIGWPILVFGVGVLLWCVCIFYVVGKGTLAPWDPPKRLVTCGPYRFVRNPMYLGVLGLVAGWSLLAGSYRLGEYAVVLAVGFHLRVILFEEPRLRRQFGSDWTQYWASVNRWVPKLRTRSAR